MNEAKLKQDFQKIDESIYIEINEILKRHNYDWYICLAEIVAAIFDVDKCDILTKDKSEGLVYARWTYWYALNTFCHKNYREIAEDSSIDDTKFVPNTIKDGIICIQALIAQNAFYAEKWRTIKRLVESKIKTRF